jgi:signal transduction histidine kinase
MKRPSYTILGLLYLAVLVGTVLDANFSALSAGGLEFYVGLGLAFALSILILQREEPSTTQVLGTLAAQLVIFYLLHKLPIPHWTLWLLAMPVISHVTYCLRWGGAAISGTAYMALILWISRDYGFAWSDVVRNTLQFGIGCLFTVVFTHVTRQAVHAQAEADRLAKELEEANARLRASADRDLAHAAMSERNRIARDIHDGLGHHLTIIAVQLEAARKLMKENPERAAETIGSAERQSREALEEVRRSVRTLRTNAPAPDLRDALAGLINESGLVAGFQVFGEPRILSPSVVQAFFRTAQEGLTNIRKHAGARQVRVELRYAPQTTILEILDDGRGSSGVSGGFGLAGLRERLEAIGGHVHAANRPEGGYVLKAEVTA